jgi:hypothetical protein
MYMNNKGESDLLETFSSIVKGTGDWFGAAVPTAQTYVWWVAGAFLSIAAFMSVSTWRSRRELVPRTRTWRRNPTVSGMRHARR